MGLNVSLWKCECGVHLKAVTATEEGRGPINLHVECPRCGHIQTLIANQILSVSEEKTQNTPSARGDDGCAA
jgi:phage FluMu protein Com